VSFLELQLDAEYSYGSQGGPGYTTLVTAVPSRSEQRVQLSSRGYRRYRINYQDKSPVQMASLRDFFATTQGKTHGFRHKDILEYKIEDEPLTAINTAGVYTAQLSILYDRFGGTEVRPITKPQTALVPITLTRNGSPFASSGNWSLNTTTGLITFTADQSSQELEWSGQFDVPVRFDFDEFEPEYADFGVVNWDSVTLLEIPV
jgi:uncharacterized protein (TIGR02217 family)